MRAIALIMPLPLWFRMRSQTCGGTLSLAMPVAAVRRKIVPSPALDPA